MKKGDLTMNYQDFTHTDFNLKKRNKRTDYILTLSKFRNNTLNMETPIKPSSWYESIDDYLYKDTLVDKSTGEIILQWNDKEITYINKDYEITMTQHHKCTDNREEIDAHNDFIKSRNRGI